MLMQTNSYVVAKENRTEHARLLNRFRQTLTRLGCDQFEVYEQTGSNWSSESTGRFVQIMRFRDRKHQLSVQAGERDDPQAQQLIKEFCELINFPYQQQQGLFAVGFYNSVLPIGAGRPPALVQETTSTQAVGGQSQDQSGAQAPPLPENEPEPQGAISPSDESGLEIEPLSNDDTATEPVENLRIADEASERADKHQDNGEPQSQEDQEQEHQQPHSL